MKIPERIYWEHKPTGDIYLFPDRADYTINLRTGESKLIRTFNFHDVVKNFEVLDQETIDILQSYFAQLQPSRTPKKGIVSRVISDIKETVQLVKNDRCSEPLF